MINGPKMNAISPKNLKTPMLMPLGSLSVASVIIANGACWLPIVATPMKIAARLRVK